jgi:cytochrome c biogenesis protein CcmG/thiol:disulfide interchange protein DsbE
MFFRLLSAILFSLTLALPVQAEELDLSAYKGKVVYLDFWASWCVPCRLSFPWMNQVQQVYASKGVVVIAVNVDRDRAQADEFLGQMPHNFRIVYDPSGKIAGQFNFKDMPTSVLIGRDGKQHFVHSGFFPAQEGEYTAHLESLIGSGS